MNRCALDWDVLRIATLNIFPGKNNVKAKRKQMMIDGRKSLFLVTVDGRGLRSGWLAPYRERGEART